MKKILNVIGRLNIGGAEINAMNILRHINRTKYDYHFLVFQADQPDDMEKEAKDLGATIKKIQEPKLDYKAFVKEFDELLKNEKYDVVHVNTLWNTGLITRIAKKNGVKTRISHSHSTESSAVENWQYKAYKHVMKKLIRRNANLYIACGQDAGDYLYGDQFFSKNGHIIYNGVNIEQFKFNKDKRTAVRNQLGISEDTFIIGHVGRLAPVKNHQFMLHLFGKIIDKYPNVKMMFVGDGPDYAKIQAVIQQNNWEDRVILLGKRHDVNELLQAFDLLLFPSLYEGFPLSLVEAQASGIPCIVSANVTSEALLKSDSIALELNNEQKWIDSISHYIDNPVERENIDIHQIVDKFDVKKMAEKWEEIYDA